jgi:hypothetical protein
MSRGSQPFKQGDATKAIKAAVNAGLAVMRIEIQDGKIVVVTGQASRSAYPAAGGWHRTAG